MLLVEIATRFGENLTRCRRDAGLSQEELGVRASLHRTEIGLLERGERLPRIDTVIKLAGALSIPPAELIEGIDWAPGSTTSGAFSVVPSGDPRAN
jgi:transcriptional regulator with XRE-family HTH domain